MPRDADPIIEDLRRWGIAQANRYAFSRSDRTVHALESARDMAPGTRENALRDLVGRDGSSRRRFLAERAGVDRLTIVPTWAVDPVRSSNDADRPHDNPEIAVDVGVPEDLRWVDRALASLSRQSPLRAMIIETEYTVSASQAAKTAMVRKRYGGVLTLRQYRYELSRGLDLMRGKAAA